MKIPRLAGLDSTTLRASIGLDYTAAIEVAREANRFYVARRIETRGKTRDLRVPTGPLKRMQTQIHGGLLRDAQWSSCVYCCRGRGVTRAAQVHVGHPAVLQLDIKDFFPSVRPARVTRALRTAGANVRMARLLCRLVTFNHQLPQGASTSVGIGNLVLARLDSRLATLARKHGFAYTRYVDDLVLSGGSRLARFERTAETIVRDCGVAYQPQDPR